MAAAKRITIGVTSNKINNPGDQTVKRDQEVEWTCASFDFEVYFDPAKNTGKNPEHPFKTAPPSPPPGHVKGKKGEVHKRHVRPRSASSTIPNGTHYSYTHHHRGLNGRGGPA
jgi:hypothetical protein